MPPLYLVPRVVKYLFECSAVGILVIPYWCSAYFWPFISKLIDTRDSPVVNTMKLGDIFKRGRNNKSLFGSKFWSGSSLVLKIDFHH